MRFTRSANAVLLGAVLLSSFSLNAVHLDWGLPGLWHPDEITHRSVRLVLTKSANPEFFKYPSLQIYLVALIAATPFIAVVTPSALVRTVDTSEFHSLLDALVPEITLYARFLTALMGTLTVLIVYKTARRIFDELAALLSAIFLAFTAGFIGLSHFATVDIPVTFWMALAFYCCVLALEADTLNRYIVAGVVVGLGVSTKYTAVLMIPTLLLTYFLNTGRPISKHLRARVSNKSLLLIGLAVSMGFLVGTPYAVFTPAEFLRDFIQLNLFQSSYGGVDRRGFVPHLENLLEISGAFLFTASILACCYTAYLLLKHKRGSYCLLLFTLLVVYLWLGSMRFHPQRYIIVAVPFLAMCVGRLIADCTRMASRRSLGRRVAISVSVVGIGFSLYYSYAAVAQMGNDDRIRARQWILENVNAQDSIEIPALYGFDLPEEYRRVRYTPYYHYKETFLRMKTSRTYRHLSAIYLWIKGLQGSVDPGIARKVVPPKIKEPPATSLEALLERRPRFLILASRHYERFLSETSRAEFYFPLQNRLYRSILEGSTPYKRVADFIEVDDWLTPKIEFVHGGITIFEYRE